MICIITCSYRIDCTFSLTLCTIVLVVLQMMRFMMSFVILNVSCHKPLSHHGIQQILQCSFAEKSLHSGCLVIVISQINIGRVSNTFGPTYTEATNRTISTEKTCSMQLSSCWRNLTLTVIIQSNWMNLSQDKKLFPWVTDMPYCDQREWIMLWISSSCMYGGKPIWELFCYRCCHDLRKFVGVWKRP